jgi:hypothetical protein
MHNKPLAAVHPELLKIGPLGRRRRKYALLGSLDNTSKGLQCHMESWNTSHNTSNKIQVPIPNKGRSYFIHYCIHTDSVANPASYPPGSRGPSPRG